MYMHMLHAAANRLQLHTILGHYQAQQKQQDLPAQLCWVAICVQAGYMQAMAAGSSRSWLSSTESTALLAAYV
jgi:hypothetical protein